jgi:hypothetical protein
MSRGTLECLLIAATALALSFFTQNVAQLTDCRNYARSGDPVSRLYFLKNACPDPGPYSEYSSVFLYAMLVPFIHPTSVASNTGEAGRWRISTAGGSSRTEK